MSVSSVFSLSTAVLSSESVFVVSDCAPSFSESEGCFALSVTDESPSVADSVDLSFFVSVADSALSDDGSFVVFSVSSEVCFAFLPRFFFFDGSLESAVVVSCFDSPAVGLLWSSPLAVSFDFDRFFLEDV